MSLCHVCRGTIFGKSKITQTCYKIGFKFKKLLTNFLQLLLVWRHLITKVIRPFYESFLCLDSSNDRKIIVRTVVNVASEASLFYFEIVVSAFFSFQSIRKVQSQEWGCKFTKPIKIVLWKGANNKANLMVISMCLILIVKTHVTYEWF